MAEKGRNEPPPFISAVPCLETFHMLATGSPRSLRIVAPLRAIPDILIMKIQRTILRVTTLLFVALGAGHLVQNMQKNQPAQVVQPGTIGGLQQVVAGAEHRLQPKAARGSTSTGTVIHPPQFQEEPLIAPAGPAVKDDQSALDPGSASESPVGGAAVWPRALARLHLI